MWTPDLGKSSRGPAAARLRRPSSLGSACRLLAPAPPGRDRRDDDAALRACSPRCSTSSSTAARAIVLWSMDCYPDAAERFGELRPAGWSAGVPAAAQPVAVPPGRGRRRARRRHGRAAPRRSTPAVRDRPRFEVIPNWERLDAVPGRAPSSPWAGYDDAAPSTAARSCCTSATPASATGSARCWTPPRGSRDEALFLFVGGGARWADLEREVARRRADQRRAPRLRAQGRDAGGDGRRRPRPHHARRPLPRGDEPVEAPRQPGRRPARAVRRPGGQQRGRGHHALRRGPQPPRTAT